MKTKNLEQLELNGVEPAEGAPKVIDFNEGKMVAFEATASKVHEAKPKVVADAGQTVTDAKPIVSRPANRVNEFPILPDGERLLRIHEVAILLRVSDKTVRRMIIAGQLTSRKIRGLRLIRWSDLSNLLNQTA